VTSTLRPLELTPDLESVARRSIWFLAPAAACERPALLIAYVLTYGTAEDVAVLRQHVGDADLVAVLDLPPPGVFDGRSWAYWNLKLKGLHEPPPLPHRTFGAVPADSAL
jgi:hypothetical protein